MNPHDTRYPTPELTLSPQDLARLSGPGIRAFFKIADRWGLSGADQQALLGGVRRATLKRWRREQDALLSQDQLMRVSYLLGIYKDLHSLLPATCDGWVKRPNHAAPFKGRTALEVMVTGGTTALQQVRIYLDGQLGSPCL